MIKKSGLLLLAVISYGILESIILGYSYYVIFSVILFFIISSDILLFNLYSATDLNSVRVERRVGNNSARKWQKKNVEVSFKNKSKRTVYLHYYDTLSDVFLSEGDFEGSLALKPGEEALKKYSISSVAIGKYNVGPIIMYTEDPMKICVESVTIPEVDEIKIAPALADIHSQRSERLSNFMFTRGIHYSRKAGQGYNFFGLRQYTESDDFRYVAWSRYGIINGEDLYIKQMEEERQIDVIFLIDYSINVNQGTNRKRMYDKIVSTVINAAYTILKNHDGVGFSLDSTLHDYFITPKKSQEPIQKLQKIISEIRPMGQFSIESAIEKIKKNVKKNALIFIISPFSYPEGFRHRPKGDFRAGKQVYLFLVDPYDFVEKREDEVYEKLLLSAGTKVRRRLVYVSKFFNGVGIKTSVSREKELLVRIMAEYSYGKMINEGA